VNRSPDKHKIGDFCAAERGEMNQRAQLTAVAKLRCTHDVAIQVRSLSPFRRNLMSKIQGCQMEQKNYTHLLYRTTIVYYYISAYALFVERRKCCGLRSSPCFGRPRMKTAKEPAAASFPAAPGVHRSLEIGQARIAGTFASTSNHQCTHSSPSHYTGVTPASVLLW
jgi:hypothetical protein